MPNYNDDPFGLNWMFDENGNPLFDQYGNPLDPPPNTTTNNTTPPAPDFDDIMGRFSTAQSAKGMTEAEWRNTDEWKAFNTEIRDAITRTDDKDWLIASRDWQLQNLNDPVYGDHYTSLSDKIQDRIDALENPLYPFLRYAGGNTTRTDTQINADRGVISNEADNAYASLLAFQREQGRYTQELADQIRLSREFAIPRLPERNGTFVAGGGAAQANPTRTGVSDLLIRF